MIRWRNRLVGAASNRTFIVLVAATLGLVLTFHIARQVQDQEYQQRALTLAQSIAAIPEVDYLVSIDDPNHQLQELATQIAKKTHATYIVIADHNGVRLSHPNPKKIGQRLTTLEAGVVLAGTSTTELDHGSLGVSANGRTPIFNNQGKVIGLVSAGYLTSNFGGEVSSLRTSFLLYGFGIILLGFMLAEILARRLRNRRVETELEETRLKFQERDAMLHAIKEGVITLTRDKKIGLINDEAKRLLGLNDNVIGKQIESVVSEGRLLDLLEGEVFQGDDEQVLNERFSLRVNHKAVKQFGRDIGSIITLRDRTEHIGLMRELDSVKNLTNALRAQQHEYANRMHTINGLLELHRYEDAKDYLGEIASLDADLAETLNNKIANPVITALLLAKTVFSREKGVTLVIESHTSLDDLKLEQDAQITVIGNLIDNAIEATASAIGGIVTVSFEDGSDSNKRITVRDTGPGLPEPSPEVVFQDGFSTKSAFSSAHRGLGLAIVYRLVAQVGGRISCFNDKGAVFVVEIPVHS
jgi:two-component system CitB family sensor kinase